MPRSQRVLLMVHPAHRPDRARSKSQTEKDIWNALKRCGFHTRLVSLQSSLSDLQTAVDDFKPHVAFNLLEEFKDEAVFDFHPVSWLEAQGIPYTGCNPRGLILTRNKFWMSQLAQAIGIPVPKTWDQSEFSRLEPLDFPVIVKFCNEHASLGLTQASVVKRPSGLRTLSRRLRTQHAGRLIAQSFVSGREMSVSVMGHMRPRVFHPREVLLGPPQAIMTERLKFSAKLRHKKAIRARFVPGPPTLISELEGYGRALFTRFGLNGYARFDFRLDEGGAPFLIDVNVNPNLERSEDFALSARRAGYSYEELICELIQDARKYRPQI